MLDPDRYVYVEADAAQLYQIARGLRDWKAASADGSVHLCEDPAPMHDLPGWFLPVDAASREPAGRAAVDAVA